MANNLPKDLHDTLKTDGPVAMGWECFTIWLRRWRREHPEDERTMWQLAEVYAQECAAEAEEV